jgi:hypothetical protein
MPFGAPDFSNIRKETLVHRLDDLAEASVRTFIPVVYDRLGDVVFFDSFESGVLWKDQTLASPNARFYIGYGCGLNSPRALVYKKPAGLNGYSQIAFHAPYYATKTVGYSICVKPGFYFTHLLFGMAVADTVTYYGFDLRIYKSSGKIEVTHGSGRADVGYVPPASLSPYDWLWLKFVVNIQKGRWERIMIHTFTFDARAFKLYTPPANGAAVFWITIGENANTEAPDVTLFDNLIITINEPVSD